MITMLVLPSVLSMVSICILIMLFLIKCKALKLPYGEAHCLTSFTYTMHIKKYAEEKVKFYICFH